MTYSKFVPFNFLVTVYKTFSYSKVFNDSVLNLLLLFLFTAKSSP